MKKKLFLLLCALLTMIGVQAQPVASTPEVGQVYYLYNPITKLFMTTNVDLPFVRPTGSAWRLEAAAGHDGWITLRLKDNNTEGCGYFWGKWWANNPAQSSAAYADERVFKLVNTSGENYKLQSYAWGTTEAYIYINNGNSSDRSFRLACNSQDQGGLDAGYLTWQFISEADYAAYMTKDYTANIQNNDFLNGTNNWTLTGGGNKQALGNTAIEHWQEKAADGNFDYYQNVVVPAGKYVLRAAMFNSTNGEEGASFSAPGQCGVYGTSNNVTKNANVSVDGNIYNIYTTEELLVPDGNLRLGFKNSATMTARWFGADWIQLTCIEYCLSTVAEELPASGVMDADTWYYCNIPTSDDYEFTSSAATTLTYTAEGAQLISEATGTDEAFTAGQKKDIGLTNGRLYFKTSAATTLSISYKYNVGTATADKEYIQPGQEVTVTWADATTNDPSASFAKNGTPNITFNGSSVDIETTAKGFSFTIPGGLTANTEYTLAIPADAFGYAAGSTYNAAQEFTLKTPALYDGTYYIKTSDGRYVSRGNNYNSRAIVDKYGIAVTTVTDGSGKTTFQLVDNNKNLFEANNHEVYADNTNDKYWTVSATTGGFYIASANDKGSLGWKLQITVNGDSNYKYDYLMCSENSGSVFTFEATTSHASQIAAMKDAQAASVATAIGQGSITTKAALDAYAATLSSYAHPEVNKIEGGAEIYQGTGDITQTLTGLPNGLYKVSVNAFQRITGYSADLYSGGYDLPTTSLYANSEEINVCSPFEQVEKSDKKWSDVTGDTEDKEYEGYYYPNNVTSAKNAIAAGNYKNEIYVNVTDGTLRFGIYKANKIGNADWLYYKDFAVTYYSAGDAEVEIERSVLSNKIDAANATIPKENVGTNAFQYNQTEVSARLPKIHTAEGVYDNPSATAEQLKAQTTIMEGETTAIGQNAPAEHQQFYLQQVSGKNWADFSDGCKLNSEAKVVYFTAVSGGYKLSNDETKFVYYSGTGNDKWSLNTTTEGGATWTVEYLGAGKYALHSDNGYLGSDASASGSALYGNKGKNVSNSNWIIVDSKVTMTIDGTAKKGTFCAPFDIAVSELPEGVTAYTADGVSGSHLALTEVTETIPAGTPVILDAPGIAATTSKDFIGVYASEPKNTGVLKGVYATTLITSDDDNSLYIMQYKSGTTAFYKVPTDDSRRVGANRCYLLIEGESPARINLGEEIDPTAINAVKVADAKADGLKDGKYLINGKIVLVKNGVMYSTNGQKLN